MAIEPHHVKPSKLHSRRGSAENSENREVKRIEERKCRGINHRIHARKVEMSAQRAEKPQKPDVNQRQENKIQQTGLSPLVQLRHRHQRRLRMSPRIARSRKNELRLQRR